MENRFHHFLQCANTLRANNGNDQTDTSAPPSIDFGDGLAVKAIKDSSYYTIMPNGAVGRDFMRGGLSIYLPALREGEDFSDEKIELSRGFNAIMRWAKIHNAGIAANLESYPMEVRVYPRHGQTPDQLRGQLHDLETLLTIAEVTPLADLNGVPGTKVANAAYLINRLTTASNEPVNIVLQEGKAKSDAILAKLNAMRASIAEFYKPQKLPGTDIGVEAKLVQQMESESVSWEHHGGQTGNHSRPCYRLNTTSVTSADELVHLMQFVLPEDQKKHVVRITKGNIAYIQIDAELFKDPKAIGTISLLSEQIRTGGGISYQAQVARISPQLPSGRDQRLDLAGMRPAGTG